MNLFQPPPIYVFIVLFTAAIYICSLANVHLFAVLLYVNEGPIVTKMKIFKLVKLVSIKWKSLDLYHKF